MLGEVAARSTGAMQPTTKESSAKQLAALEKDA